MGNINNAHALAAQVIDDIKQHNLFRIGQRSCRFIKDHRLGVDCQSAGNFDHLFVGNRKIANDCLGGKAALQAIENGAGICVQFFEIHTAIALSGQFTQIDIFGDAQLISKA